MRQHSLVLVDIEEADRELLDDWCRRRSLSSVAVSEPQTLYRIEGSAPALCVIGSSGECELSKDRIRFVRKSLGDCPIVVLARGIGVETAINLIRAGVDDVVEVRTGRRLDPVRLDPFLRVADDAVELAGVSSVAQVLRQEISTAARLKTTVLITGESGVGKRIVAREIHRRAGPQAGAFVELACDELGPREIDVEFSHSGRTVFLDEVSDLSLQAQARLLRKLSAWTEHVQRRAGAALRVIAASSRDLNESVAARTFRGDLYLNLKTITIRVPPLRERAEDLAAIATAKLNLVAERLHVEAPRFSDDALDELVRHAWPGNLAELDGWIERVVVRHPGSIVDAEALGLSGASEPAESSSDVSRSGIASVLAATGGNISRAARRLGLPRTTLRYRIRSLGLAHMLPDD